MDPDQCSWIRIQADAGRISSAVWIRIGALGSRAVVLDPDPGSSRSGWIRISDGGSRLILAWIDASSDTGSEHAQARAEMTVGWQGGSAFMSGG